MCTHLQCTLIGALRGHIVLRVHDEVFAVGNVRGPRLNVDNEGAFTLDLVSAEAATSRPIVGPSVQPEQR